VETENGLIKNGNQEMKPAGSRELFSNEVNHISSLMVVAVNDVFDI
jgi:hypothetical protein